MEQVLVVGAGFMGAGIAQVCAQSGREVFLYDAEPVAVEKALKGISFSLGKLAAKGALQEPAETVLARVRSARGLDPAADCHWVVEAASERLEVKQELFRQLDRLAPAGTPLGSNTSSIPIDRLAQATANPGRVLGLHFFGPVPLMGLVEVVKGPRTSPEIFRRSLGFITSLGKTPVKVTRDIPGFVMNRVFSAAFAQAADLVAAGVTTPQDVDAGMRLGYGWRAGPFEIVDNAGLDTVSLIGAFLKSAGQAELAPKSDLVERMLAMGRLGRKNGEGFYSYGPDGKARPRPEEEWLCDGVPDIE